MPIPYVVRKKVDTSGEERKEMWYAVSKKMQKKGGVTENDLARMIASYTGFNRGDIKGIITELANTIERVLADGQSVTIKGFGSFQTALTSKGFEHPTEVTPKEVSVSRVYFIANRRMTQRLKKTPCIRIPFKYYFPKEMLTKDMLKEDEKTSLSTDMSE